MRLIHAAGFNSGERETYRSIVFINIIQSMRLILEAMEYFRIPLGDNNNKVNKFLILFVLKFLFTLINNLLLLHIAIFVII
jgi:hypothetical protein